MIAVANGPGDLDCNQKLLRESYKLRSSELVCADEVRASSLKQFKSSNWLSVVDGLMGSEMMTPASSFTDRAR